MKPEPQPSGAGVPPGGTVGIALASAEPDPEPCRKHPRYKAVLKPRVTCAPCWALWNWKEQHGRAH